MDIYKQAYVIFTSWNEEAPDRPFACYSRVEKAQRFIEFQQGIDFPYTKWTIERIIWKNTNQDSESVILLMAQKEEERPYEIIMSCDGMEQAHVCIEENKTNWVDYECYELNIE